MFDSVEEQFNAISYAFNAKILLLMIAAALLGNYLVAGICLFVLITRLILYKVKRGEVYV